MRVKVRVRRLFTIVNGGTPTRDQRNWDGDVPWATPVDLARVNGGLLTVTDRTLTTEGLSSGSRAVPPDSLIISTRAPIGYVAETPASTAFNQGCRGLIPRVPMVLSFFRYQFASLTEQLVARGQGSTFDELSGDALADLPLTVPSLEDQGAILKYLDSEMARIDALITAKQGLVQVLDERLLNMAHRLTSSHNRVPLRRLVEVVKTGATPPSDEFEGLQGKELPWYSPGDFAGWLRLKEPARSLHKRAASEGWVPSFPAQSVLVVGIGATAGKIAFLGSEGTGNQQLTCLVTGPRLKPRFLAWQLLARQDELRATAPFTTLPILNNDFIRSLGLSLPPLSEQEDIADRLDLEAARMLALRKHEEKQVVLLKERRQALITAAVTGQLDIPEAA